MSGVKTHISRATRLLAAGKRVLFVEGKDDTAIYAKWLAKIDPLFANRLELIATYGRNDVDMALALLAHPANAFALRDRDEWDTIRIATAQASSPRLLVNGTRHCLESYFCDPDEIMAALRARYASKYGPAEPMLRAAVSGRLPDYVDHWAMWTTAMQLQGDMVSAGYASCFHNVLPLPPDADIQARLDAWAGLADSGNVWTAFSDLRDAARAKPVVEKHRGCVHGKKYWADVVLPALRRIEVRGDWMIDLADWSPVPLDLDPLLRTVLV